MKRRYFHIVHNLNGGWDFKEQGSPTIIKHEEYKAVLVQYAAEYCGKLFSELVIHDHWAKVEDRRTYGKDPFPPIG